MTITRAQAERVLIGRCGTLMTAAGLDGVTDSQNTDLNGPLMYALLRLGHTSIDNLQAIDDDDVSAVSNAEIASFLDIAEFRLLQNIHDALIEQVDVTVGPRRELFSQRAKNAKDRIGNLREQIKEDHGIGVGSLEIGNLNLNFQTKGDDELYGTG